jgi:Bifunctional DNA primase/polymerase, N-terminal
MLDNKKLAGNQPIQETVNPVLAAALAHAAAGIPVFPCEPSTKEPVGTLVPPDRNPRGRGYARGTGGFKKATRDPDTIREWWSMRPDAMLGIPTGAASGVFIIDLDVPKQVKRGPLGEVTPDGIAAWAAAGITCKTYEVETGSGGRHIYFRYNPEHPITNKEGAFKGRGINVRGDGGYVVIPPSHNCNGGQYRPANGLAMADAADAPEALYKLLQGTRKIRKPVRVEPEVGARTFDDLDGKLPFPKTRENSQLLRSALNATPSDDRQNEWFPVLCALNSLVPEWDRALNRRMVVEKVSEI